MQAKRKRVKWLVALLLLVAIPVTLHLWNRWRLDLRAFQSAVEEDISRSLEVADWLAADGDLELARTISESATTRSLGIDNLKLVERLEAPPPLEVHTVESTIWRQSLGDGQWRPPAAREHSLRFRWEVGNFLAADLQPAIRREALDGIRLRMRNRTGTRARLRWSDDQGPLPEQVPNWTLPGAATIDLVTGETQEYWLDAETMMAEGPSLIHRLYLDMSNAEDTIELESVELVPRGHQYLSRGLGEAHHRLAGDLRQSLFIAMDHRLEWEVVVPRGSPRMKAVWADLLADRTEATVRVETLQAASAGDRTVSFEQTLVVGEEWQEWSTDLSSFAGQPVRVVVETEAAEPNVLFLSRPRIYTPRENAPSILWVVYDTLRADHLGTYGYKRETDPVLRDLARSGTVFSNAYSQAPRTRESAASYKTGIYPTGTSVWSFTERLSARGTTIAEVLSLAGYETASFVENPSAGAANGLHQGYDLVVEDTERRRGERVVPRLMEWLQRPQEEPRFAYLHLLDPHGPYAPVEDPANWLEGRPREPSIEPSSFWDPEDVERTSRSERIARYDAEIRANDRLLARVLEAFGEIGETRVVVFSSDHGEALGERGRWGHAPPSWNEVVHVPLILVAPGRVPAGLRVSTPTPLLDLFPTLLELAEQPAWPSQGRSLARHWLESTQSRRNWVFVEEVADQQQDSFVPWTAAYGDSHSVLYSEDLQRRSARMKWQTLDYLWMRVHQRTDGGFGGPKNLYYGDFLLKRRLRALLARRAAASQRISERLGSAATSAIDAAERRQLKALGYL